MTGITFAPGLRNGFLYDDYYLVETNPTLRAPGSLAHYLSTPLFAGVQGAATQDWAAGSTQYWRPFLKLAFLVQFRVFGTAPRGWHVVGLLLHMACVWMAFAWLRRRVAGSGAGAGVASGTGADSASNARVIAAGVAALLFALHPSRCEAVAWVSGSADLWMTFWVLVGLLAWDRRGALATAGAVIAFALAVFSKETAVVVPLCLAADAWLLSPVTRPTRAAGAARAPGSTRLAWRSRFAVLFGMLASVVVLRFVLLPGAAGVFRFEPTPARALASLGLYVARTVWPLHPSTQIGLMDASERFVLPPWSIALGLATLVGFMALCMVARHQRPLRPIVADALWFLLPLAPVVNLLPLGYTTLVAERFLYLPFLGLAALATRGLYVAIQRAGGPVPVLAGAAAVAVGYAVICARYLPKLRDNATLWAYEIHLAPESPQLRLYQAQAEWQAGRLEPAMAAARASYDRAKQDDARAEAALSWASTRFQITAGREVALLAALRDFFDALTVGHGSALLEADGLRFDVQPTAAFRSDLEQRTSLRLTRAVAHARTGDATGAERLLRDLQRDDTSPAVAGNLARVLAHQERWDEALQVLVAAQQPNPSDPMLAELRAPIEVGRTLAQRDAAAGETSRLDRARLWIALGAPDRARRELEALGEESAGEADVVLVAAMADAADGDLEAARRRIEAARQRYPERGATWDAALVQVQDLASNPSQANAPRASKLDALFR